MLGTGDLEPLAGEQRAVVMLPAIGPLGVAVEEAEHLPAIGDAEVDLADGRLGHGEAPGHWRAGARVIPYGSPSSSALPDPSPAAASPSGRVKGRRQPGEASPLRRTAGMRHSAFLSFNSASLLAFRSAFQSSASGRSRSAPHPT